MSKPVDPASMQLVDATGRSPEATVGYALTSLPIILFVVFNVVTPGFTDLTFARQPAFLGLPVGLVVLFSALVWAVIGILAARGARSNARILLALAVFTLPASIAVLLGPPLILIILNL